MYQKSYRLDYMLILSVILLFVIQIAYGHSYLIYVMVMSSMILISFYYFLKNIKKYPIFCVAVCLYNVGVSFFVGFYFGGFQDALMAGVSLILPFVFASYHMKTDKIESCCWKIAIGLIVVHLLKPYVSVFAKMNVNSYSFLMFMGFTSAFILVQLRKEPTTIAMLVLVLYVLLNSGSRNAFTIALVIVVVSLLPYKILTNKIAYRVIYGFSILYQVFSKAWLEYVEQNQFWSKLFITVVQSRFNKRWGLEKRAEILENVSGSIWKNSFFQVVFGNGTAYPHAHNGFYQTMYMYGLIGTVLIFIMYIMIFEWGFRVMKKSENTLVMGCVLSLCGILLIQGADVFLWGVKTCSVVPFLLTGIIVRTYMEQK